MKEPKPKKSPAEKIELATRYVNNMSIMAFRWFLDMAGGMVASAAAATRTAARRAGTQEKKSRRPITCVFRNIGESGRRQRSACWAARSSR
jgi:hypothetical protein